MGDTLAITEITTTNPMIREVNRGLMVDWINCDLGNRSFYDVRSSLVFYDSDMVFFMALPISLLSVIGDISDVLNEHGVRYYSKGIV
jgi:hypothetical protein